MLVQDDRPRIALRPDDPADARPDGRNEMVRLDDVYVKDVKMFRAEMMDEGVLWMRCYLDDDRFIDFSVTAKHSHLILTCTDLDTDDDCEVPGE